MKKKRASEADMPEIDESVGLDAITEEVLQQKASVEKLLQGATMKAISLGRFLHAARKRCPHGQWHQYVERECGINKRTANNYIRLWRKWQQSDEQDRKRVAESTVSALLEELAKPRKSPSRAKSHPRKKPAVAPFAFAFPPKASWSEIVGALGQLAEPCAAIREFCDDVAARLDELQPKLQVVEDVVAADRQTVEGHLERLNRMIRRLTSLRQRLRRTLQ